MHRRKYRAGWILVLGFGTLLVLIGFLGFSAYHKAEQINGDVAAIHESYRKSAYVLNDVLADTYRSSILVRDYLLDTSPIAGAQYRQDLREIRTSTLKGMDELIPLISEDERTAVDRLRHELEVYWDSMDPIFEWTLAQKAANSTAFLKREVTPRRKSVVSMTRDIDKLNAANLAKEQEKINSSRADFRAYLGRMLAITLILAVAVAAASGFRISSLERSSEQQQLKTARAEQELRRLSQQLVQAQEQERKAISRELHDEIGQMVTGLRMELANLERLRSMPGEDFKNHMKDAKSLAEKTLHSVRDLAMGLRPSMLDDLGLEPAIQWQAREFSRRSGIPVTVDVDGSVETASEALRTCVYRIVQESLTNCARHAQAKSVTISLHGSAERVSLAVQDDGVGFDAQAPSGRGLGLLGMEERVKKLGGTISVRSQMHRGTVLKVEFPLAKEAKA